MNITEKSKTTVKMKNNEESNSNAANLLMRLSILARNAWSLSKLSNSQHLSLNHLVANLLESKTCENQYVYSQNFLRNYSFDQSKHNSDSKKIFTPVPLRAVNPHFKNLIEKLYNSTRSNGSSFACRNELDDKSKNIDSKGAKFIDLSLKQEETSKFTPIESFKGEADAWNQNSSLSEQIESKSKNIFPSLQDLECNLEAQEKDEAVIQITCNSKTQKFRKSIRKQTSFARTEEWSYNDLYEEKEQPSITEPKIQDEGCINIETNAKLYMKVSSAIQDLAVCDEISYNSQFSLEQENKFKLITPSESQKMVGLLTAEQRKTKVDNYLAK